jgi:hypothetical protein
MDCQNCAALARENRELRQTVEKQRKTITRLQSRIDRARYFCAVIYSQASRVMSDHQPRGTWSLWRGRGEMAAKIYNMLSTGA